MFLAIAVLASSAFRPKPLAAHTSEVCVLPEDLQREVAAKYPTAKLIELSDLVEDDRKFFQSDHDNSCPGVVKVDFYGDGKPTFALVLIPRGGASEPNRLVVAHRDDRQWVVTPLDKGGTDVAVVWSLPPGEYHDVYGDKTIRSTKPVIVFCKYEAWAILYAWTAKGVHKAICG